MLSVTLIVIILVVPPSPVAVILVIVVVVMVLFFMMIIVVIVMMMVSMTVIFPVVTVIIIIVILMVSMPIFFVVPMAMCMTVIVTFIVTVSMAVIVRIIIVLMIMCFKLSTGTNFNIVIVINILIVVYGALLVFQGSTQPLVLCHKPVDWVVQGDVHLVDEVVLGVEEVVVNAFCCKPALHEASGVQLLLIAVLRRGLDAELPKVAHCKVSIDEAAVCNAACGMPRRERIFAILQNNASKDRMVCIDLFGLHNQAVINLNC
jgi:hypothetical protein